MRGSFKKIEYSEKTLVKSQERLKEGSKPFKFGGKVFQVERKSSVTALKERCVWNVLRTASVWGGVRE